MSTTNSNSRPSPASLVGPQKSSGNNKLNRSRGYARPEGEPTDAEGNFVAERSLRTTRETFHQGGDAQLKSLCLDAERAGVSISIGGHLYTPKELMAATTAKLNAKFLAELAANPTGRKSASGGVSVKVKDADARIREAAAKGEAELAKVLTELGVS